MMKKIISALLIFTLAAAFFPMGTVYADSEFTVKTTSGGKSYVAAYNGSGGSVIVPANVGYIGDSAFKNNTKITSVTIPSGCNVEKNAFLNCVNLKSVTFEGNISHIEDSAFMNCTSLENVVFRKSDTSLKYVGQKAFANCFSLKQIALPSNTTAIYDFAFGNCASLEYVTVPKSVTDMGSHAIGFMYDEKTKKYFAADGETAAYVSFYQIYENKLMEWYAPKTGEPVAMNVVKGSAGANYAKKSGLKYTYYKSAEIPKVTAEAELDSITLKWTKTSGADAYRVSILKGNKFEEYKITAGRACAVKGLESGKAYTFKVTVLKTVKANKYSDLISSEAVTVTTKAEPVKTKSYSDIPEAPKVRTEASADSVTLKWKKVANASGYRVDMYNEQTGKYEKYKTAKGTACIVSGLARGTQYKFKVTTLYSVKGKTHEGGTADGIVVSTSADVRS